MKLEPRHPEANLGYGMALAGLSGALPPDQQPPKATEAIAQLNRAYEIDPNAINALAEIAMVSKLQLNKIADAKTYCEKYLMAAKVGDDKDPMKADCAAIDQEITAGAAAARMREQMKQQEEEEKKNAPPPAAAPAPEAAPVAPAPAGG
jgi:hypothetical protein